MAVAATNKAATGGSAATSLASASITPTAGRLLIATVNSRTGITVDPNIPTLSGAGLTWVQIATAQHDTTGASRKRITMFRAMGTGSAGAVTADFAAQTQTDIGIVIDEFTGVDTTGTNGSGAVVQSATNVDSTITVSTLTVTLAAFGSINNATYGAFGIGSVTSTSTAGTGFTKVADLATTTNNRLTTEFVATNDTTVDMSFSGVEEIGGIAIEIKQLAGTLFTSALTASLSFVGNHSKRDRKTMTAGLSFSGNIKKAVSHKMSAGLSFVGSMKKRTARAMAGGLSFVGTFVGSHLVIVALSASLSFAGNIARTPRKSLGAGLSFVGGLNRATSHKMSAGLSFAGAFAKRTTKAFAAALSWAGALATSFFSGSGTLYTVALNASLSFIGGTPGTGIVNEPMASAPTTGTLAGSPAATWQPGGWLQLTANSGSQTGQIEWTGTLPNAFTVTFDFWTGPSGADATWFYFGNTFTSGGEDSGDGYALVFDDYNSAAHPYRIMWAGLELAGSGVVGSPTFNDAAWHSAKFTVVGDTLTIALDGVQVLSFTDTHRTLPGNRYGFGARTGGLWAEHRVRNLLVYVPSTFAKATSHVQSAGLSFVGAMNRRIAHGFTASLSFVGSIAKRARKSLAAGLSFAGNFAQARRYARALSASLSFSGSMAKRTAKGLTASLTLAGLLTIVGNIAPIPQIASFIIKLLVKSPSVTLRASAPSLILRELMPAIVLRASAPSIRLKASAPSVVLRASAPSVSLRQK